MKVSVLLTAVLMAGTGCSGGGGGPSAGHHGCATVTPARATGHPALDRWLAHLPVYVAHRGGDADWVEGTASAYRKAAGWSPELALEVPVWRTSDGVWVVSHDSSTGRVFDKTYDIRSSPWAKLSTLRTKVGGHRMARLVEDILLPFGSTRILFLDNKADTDVKAFFDLLDSYAGSTRYVSKGFYTSKNTAAEAHRRGYLIWGYYYHRDMPRFAATQPRFDLLGLAYSAPRSDFTTMRATGKPVIADVVSSSSTALSAQCKGAAGLMVSDVKKVVPHR